MLVARSGAVGAAQTVASDWYAPLFTREWRNWQTRRIQVPVPARAWGFKSPLAHVLSVRRFWPCAMRRRVFRVARWIALTLIVAFVAIQFVPHETIEEGSMPPRSYTLLHPSARLTDAEQQRLVEALTQMEERD